MRRCGSIILATTLVWVSGCKEFVTDGQQQQSSTVDVVGDPKDTTPDIPSQADVLGTVRAVPDLNDVDGLEMETTEERITAESSIEPSDESSDPSVEPEVNGEAKPVSLKKKSTTR